MSANLRLLFLIFPLFVLTHCHTSNQPSSEPSEPLEKIIIGYVPGFRGLLDVNTIAPEKLTHINYAFVDVKDSLAWLTNLETDSVNFTNLVGLKRINPELKILISIGGWSWSHNFSDAVLTPSSRKKFAQSSVAIIDQYQLDGVDIDWEYPGLKGEDNVFRPEDKQNFTLMFEAIRQSLDSLSTITEKKYLLTTAVPCFSEFLNKTEMGKASEYLDYVNLMAYDFFVSGDTAGHHSNLFPSEDYNKELSGHRAVQEFTAAGVPVEKLVLGIPFYGRSWIMKTTDNRGVNRPVESVARGGGYTFVKDSMMTKPGFVRHWDENARVPFLFNDETRQFVSFDDEESVKEKCAYVKQNDLAGVMFWQYASDPKEYLLDAINESFE